LVVAARKPKVRVVEAEVVVIWAGIAAVNVGGVPPVAAVTVGAVV
jgi:hypothetical protein